MGFNDNFPGISESIFEQLGVPAVYKTPAEEGDGTACYVIIAHDALVQAEGYEVEVVTVGTAISALYSIVGKPRKDATFTIDSDSSVYKVKGIESCNNITTKMRVQLS